MKAIWNEMKIENGLVDLSRSSRFDTITGGRYAAINSDTCFTIKTQ